MKDANFNTQNFTSHLPLHAFNSPAALKHALDLTRRESGSQTSEDMAAYIVSIIKDLNTDYATKLSLVRTTASHALFQPRNKIRLTLNRIMLLCHAVMKKIFRLSGNYNAYRSSAQCILDNAVHEIKRNSIILC